MRIINIIILQPFHIILNLTMHGDTPLYTLVYSLILHIILVQVTPMVHRIQITLLIFHLIAISILILHVS